MNYGDVRLPDRFWTKVAPCPMTGCWIWIGANNASPEPYGNITFRHVNFYSHRVAYEALVGQIREGLVLDHRCRVTLCCNPAHLDTVTPAVNSQRGLTGLKTGAKNRAKTICKRGHSLADAFIAKHTGNRHCRECSRLRCAARRAA